MGPKGRGVSTYVELFLLIGVATSASALVLVGASTYSNILAGPSLAATIPSIRQGSNVAVEKVMVSNAGTVPLTSFTINTQGIPGSQYLVTLTNAGSGAVVTPSPATGTTPASITEAVQLGTGQSLIVTITFLSGSEFAIGSSYRIQVSAYGTAQTVLAVALPA